jgi:Sec-independent protein translocase protein TatA
MLLSPQEVLVVFAFLAALLLVTTKLGLIKRTLSGFLSEFRSALQGSDDETRQDTEHSRKNLEDYDVCYQLLGITPSATPEEIREAYRRKAQQHHPDKGGDPDTMRAITEAYQKLLRRR